VRETLARTPSTLAIHHLDILANHTDKCQPIFLESGLTKSISYHDAGSPWLFVSASVIVSKPLACDNARIQSLPSHRRHGSGIRFGRLVMIRTRLELRRCLRIAHTIFLRDHNKIQAHRSQDRSSSDRCSPDSRLPMLQDSSVPLFLVLDCFDVTDEPQFDDRQPRHHQLESERADPTSQALIDLARRSRCRRRHHVRSSVLFVVWMVRRNRI